MPAKTKNLSRETVRKIRRMIKAILAEPEYYTQAAFPKEGDCGAPCCAAGWACWLNDPKGYTKLVKRAESVDWYDKGTKALGLKDDPENTMSTSLFATASAWPEPFDLQYFVAANDYRGPNHAGMAKAAAARWEHFIETDGRE